MKVVWTERSKQHLDALFRYVAEENETAARNLIVRIIELTERIVIAHPQSGRTGRVNGTRELVITKTPYTVAYMITGNTICIVAVWHQSRRWPEQF